MAQLSKLKRLVKPPKRVGRGGERGGTSGKGHKGQKARSGGSNRVGFEGGQTPLIRRLPKVGFSNYRFKKEVLIVSIGRLQEMFEGGTVITKEMLVDLGVVKPTVQLNGKKDFVLKVLGSGALTKQLTVHADAFSKSAAEAIERSGGKIALTKEM